MGEGGLDALEESVAESFVVELGHPEVLEHLLPAHLVLLAVRLEVLPDPLQLLPGEDRLLEVDDLLLDVFHLVLRGIDKAGST